MWIVETYVLRGLPFSCPCPLGDTYFSIFILKRAAQDWVACLHYIRPWIWSFGLHQKVELRTTKKCYPKLIMLLHLPPDEYKICREGFWSAGEMADWIETSSRWFRYATYPFVFVTVLFLEMCLLRQFRVLILFKLVIFCFYWSILVSLWILIFHHV
jgi:hypothetical protein